MNANITETYETAAKAANSAGQLVVKNNNVCTRLNGV